MTRSFYLKTNSPLVLDIICKFHSACDQQIGPVNAQRRSSASISRLDKAVIRSGPCSASGFSAVFTSIPLKRVQEHPCGFTRLEMRCLTPCCRFNSIGPVSSLWGSIIGDVQTAVTVGAGLVLLPSRGSVAGLGAGLVSGRPSEVEACRLCRTAADPGHPRQGLSCVVKSAVLSAKISTVLPHSGFSVSKITERFDVKKIAIYHFSLNL